MLDKYGLPHTLSTILLSACCLFLSTQSIAQSTSESADPAVTQQPPSQGAAEESDPNEPSDGGNPTSDDEEAAETVADGAGSAGAFGDPAAGEQVFTNNCKQCHAIHKQVVGPKLAGVYERQSTEWLISFIKYPQRMIESGDKHAVELYQQYQQYMPNHDFLSDQDILNVLGYIKQETEAGPAADATATNTAVDGGGVPGAAVNSNVLIGIIAALIVLLLIAIIGLILVTNTLSKYLAKRDDLNAQDQEYVNQRFSLIPVIKSPAFIGIASFLLVAVVLQLTLDGLYGIGIQIGYAPTQPIPFSHKLHAGMYEIECQYCHTSVEKGKSANIPAANICMNCHNRIRTTAPNIQKIYTAIETNTPIEWVRVHNLPDLSYFNHSQHVKVAGLECTNCHGDIAEMEVVQQYSMLTMGWCIACHRQTEVKTEDNAYYNNMLEYHKNVSDLPLYVEDIGGLECSKCHY